jgi:hypothetical protein
LNHTQLRSATQDGALTYPTDEDYAVRRRVNELDRDCITRKHRGKELHLAQFGDALSWPAAQGQGDNLL